MCGALEGIAALSNDQTTDTRHGSTLTLTQIRVRQNLTPAHFKWLSLPALRQHHRDFLAKVSADPDLPIRLRLGITDTIQFHYLIGDVSDEELDHHYHLSNEPEHSSRIFGSLIRSDQTTWPSIKLHREGPIFGVADGVHRLALYHFRGINALTPDAYDIIEPTPVKLRLRNLTLRPARMFRHFKDDGITRS